MSPTYGIANWGPLVIATDVDEAVLAAMQEWLPTYLKELSTERNLGFTLPTPKVYANTIDADEFLDHQLPALVVTTANTKTTTGGANHLYQANWNVTVSIIVRGTAPAKTRKLAALYEGAVRRCFLNKCRQNSASTTVSSPVAPATPVVPLNSPHWVSTEVAPIAASSRKGRYLAAGIGKYNVATDAAAQSFGGPDVPNADAYTPLATVTGVTTTVQAESED